MLFVNRPDAIPVTQPMWHQHTKELKQWLKTRQNHPTASFFLHPPIDSSTLFMPGLWCQYPTTEKHPTTYTSKKNTYTAAYG